MTDAVGLTVLRRSNEGTASLGLHCGDGHYAAFLALPKAVEVGELTLAEVRFDKSKALGLTIRRFDEAFIVSALGGMETQANFGVMTDDAQKSVRGEFSAGETARMGMLMAKAIQSSSQMIYRLPLAMAGVGTEGTFNLVGFAQTAAPLIKACPIS